jgi:parvulin-like peptidyl-prolyl isomerase
MERARQQAIEHEDYLRKLDIEFREKIRQEQKEWEIKHEDMKQNLKAWKLDNDNFTAYVEEFYEKSWEIYK